MINKIKEKIKQGWEWCKKKVKQILIVLGIVGVSLAVGIPEMTKSEVSLEKVQQKYEQSAEIKAKYQLDGVVLKKTNIINPELDTYKREPKDEIEITIGDNTPVVKEGFLGGESTTTEFTPSIELKRWNEVSFKIKPDLIGIATRDKDLSFEGEKIKFSTPKISYEMYEYTENEGGYKFIWYLNEDPRPTKTGNYTIQFKIETSGLDFFYQPPLTQEFQNGYSEEFQKEIVVSETQVKDLEGNILVERPENVVGSYAVYHFTKGGMVDSWGKDYKTGQAFMVYPSHLTDAEGKTSKAILKIENGIFSEEIPQEFFNKAVFPIKGNTDLGYTTLGSTLSSISSDIIIAINVNNTTGDAGTTDSFTFGGKITTTGDASWQGGLYDSASGLLSPQSDIGTIDSTTNQKWTVNFIGQSLDASTLYYPSAFLDYDSADIIQRAYNTGNNGDGKSHFGSPTFNTWPDTAAFSNNNRLYTIYATYTPSGGEERRIIIIE